MTRSRHASRPAPGGDTSTGRALAVAAALIACLLAAASGVFAAADVLLPLPAAPVPAAARPAPSPVAAQPAPSPVAAQPEVSRPPVASPGTAGATERPAAPGRLGAFGATVRDWDTGHRRDPAVSSAYDPDPALGGDGRLADRYVRVLALNGRILEYTIQLPRRTPLGAASSRALADLPPDLRPVWQQQRGRCLQAAYTSPTLVRELAEIGDPRGAVLVEYRSGVAAGSAYDASDVTSATLSALDTPTAADGPLC